MRNLLMDKELKNRCYVPALRKSGLPYPELPEKVVARESFMIGSDTLTVYEPLR